MHFLSLSNSISEMDLLQPGASAKPICVYFEAQTLQVRLQYYRSNIRYSVIAGTTTSRPFCLLSVTQPWKLRWDAWILFLTLWNCFYMPFALAFLNDEAGLCLTVSEMVIEAYLVDVAVSVRTSYVDVGTGEEVTETCRIVRYYLGSWDFAVDLISAVPYGLLPLLVAQRTKLKYMSLLKILKLLKIGKMFTFLRVEAKKKLVLRLGQLLFIFAVYLHLIYSLPVVCTDQRFPGIYTPGFVCR